MENVLKGLYVPHATLRYITRLNADIFTQSVIFFLNQTKKTTTIKRVHPTPEYMLAAT